MKPTFAAGDRPLFSPHARPQPATSGFSLIEIMIAMLLGILVVGAVIGVFVTNSKTARVQQSLSRVLENGRFASQYLNDELRLTGAQYCTEFGMVRANANEVKGQRPLVSNVQNAALLPKWFFPAVLPTVPAAPTYFVDPRLFVSGSDCDKTSGTCTPAVATAANDVNVVPAVGTGNGARAKGTDVLTVRYLNAPGATLSSVVGQDKASGANPIYLDMGTSGTNTPPVFAANDLALIADCSTFELFATAGNGSAGNPLTHLIAAGNYTGALNGTYARAQDARVFNFTRDFVSVTYYVGLRTDPQDATRMISSLMRIVNGAAAQLVVEGVERFDVTYAVTDGDRRVHFLNANQMQANSPGATCPPLAGIPPAATAGCLWRAVQGIEVSMLVNSINDSDDEGTPFRYTPDGNALQTYTKTALLPSGLAAGRMLRREFRVYANVHNYSQ